MRTGYREGQRYADRTQKRHEDRIQRKRVT